MQLARHRSRADTWHDIATPMSWVLLLQASKAAAASRLTAATHLWAPAQGVCMRCLPDVHSSLQQHSECRPCMQGGVHMRA